MTVSMTFQPCPWSTEKMHWVRGWWHMAHTEKLSPSTLHISVRDQGLSHLIVLASYLSDFTRKSKCSK